MKIMIMPDYVGSNRVRDWQPYVNYLIKPGDIVDVKLPKFNEKLPRKLNKRWKKGLLINDLEELKKSSGGLIGPRLESYVEGGKTYSELTEQDVIDMFKLLENNTNKKNGKSK